MTISARVPLSRPDGRAFTLIELLVVLGIIGILAAISIPAMQSLSGAGKFSGQMEQIKGVLDVARSYAMAQNTYVWVALYPVAPRDNSGDGLYVVTLASNDGSNPFSTWDGTYSIPYAPAGTSTTVQPVEKISMFRQLRLNTDAYFTTAQIPSLPVSDASPVPPASQLVFEVPAPGLPLILGQQPLPSGAQAPAVSVIAFGPSGTAQVGTSLSAVIGLDFQPMKGHVADAHNVAALRINGLTGTVILYRPN